MQLLLHSYFIGFQNYVNYVILLVQLEYAYLDSNPGDSG